MAYLLLRRLLIIVDFVVDALWVGCAVLASGNQNSRFASCLAPTCAPITELPALSTTCDLESGPDFFDKLEFVARLVPANGIRG